MWHVLLFLFKQKKNASVSHHIIVETFSDNVPIQEGLCEFVCTIRKWRFQLERQRMPRLTEKIWRCWIASIGGRREYANSTTDDREVKCWLPNHSWSSACHRKAGKWIPHQVNNRQMEKQKTMCEILLSRHERLYLHQIIMTEYEKWILYIEPKMQNIVCWPRITINTDDKTE